MPKSSNQGKHSKLSAEFPIFIFEEFTFSTNENGVDASFHFNLGDRYHFYPTLFIPLKNRVLTDESLNCMLPALIFHIGMIELISYWKAACSPLVVIKPAGFDQDQVRWWKNLYFNGLGEFFYLNSIDADEESFMEIRADGPAFPLFSRADAGAGVIIPVGGGKDSAVTLGLLGEKLDVTPLVLNPRGATSAVIEKFRYAGCGMQDAGYGMQDAGYKMQDAGYGMQDAGCRMQDAGYEMQDAGCGMQDAGCGMQDAGCGMRDEKREPLEIIRTIDPLLLKLNAEGFLNGHTPFSALLAFICLAAAAVTGKKYIVLSNESSANEATIPGTKINHQYSKSLEFENDFRWYVSKYITRDIEYFSFLRPVNELRIAWLFSRMPYYHEVFRSCNLGSKTDSWCGKCAKCLFTFIILSPFMGIPRLTEIFGKNLLGDTELSEILKQFTGAAGEKPFDCIGTIDEVNLALCETIRQLNGKSLPALLQLYKDSAEYNIYYDQDFLKLMRVYEPNNLPPEFEHILKYALNA